MRLKCLKEREYMGILSRIYWTRFLLGILAGFICTLYNVYVEQPNDVFSFMTGIMFALLIYLLSYYAFKSAYFTRIEKPSKLVTTGIGIYFITWIVCWTLFWTICHALLFT